MTDQDWVSLGACKHEDSALFFPGRGGECDKARAICETCPVRAECLDYALKNCIQHGIWGGKSERERRKLRMQRRREVNSPSNLGPRYFAPVAKHGVRGSYVAGCRCPDCTYAQRLYERERDRAARARVSGSVEEYA